MPSSTVPAKPPAPPDHDGEGVLVGHIQGAWGVRGDVKVVAQSSDASALLHTRRWHVTPERAPASVRNVKARRHGSGIVARIDGVADRDAAEALAGAQIRISRAHFPRTADDEYYWVDLIGCGVVNRQGEALGQVAGLIDTGAHSVLRVEVGEVESGDAAERLIPFVSAYVDEVDLATRTIRVDWGRDY